MVTHDPSRAIRHNEREIFNGALDLAGAARDAWLRKASGQDLHLERRVRRLLEVHERGVPLPTRPILNGANDDNPRAIGPYRILERIGEGGMGIVYLAEQERPVRRRVALKIIKFGMESKEVIARFESERQALAVMSHPNIARILDACATEDGRPYFVMEYVPGVSLVEYCDSRRLDVRERIRVFAAVCAAVHHAHQKGVIHRDLKPSNILVTDQDGRPTPKVIDFGVAKATGQRLSDVTIHTRLGSFIGTPEYMSPEQAETTGLNVDIRSDVYSLGAVLYELLVGTPPFRFDLRKGFLDVQRVLLETDPLPPSAHVGNEAIQAGEWANRRGTRVELLTRSLRGELDWITLKALEKDPERRYSSACELASDLKRHLAGDWVSAGPPSALYLVGKFARRQRGALLAAGLVLLTLVGGVIGTSIGLLRAKAEARRARTQAATAEQVTEFLVGLFEVSDPSEAKALSITAREVLDAGAERTLEKLKNEPEVRATLMNTIGRVYHKLGLYDDATRMLRASLSTRRELFGEEHPSVADSFRDLAELCRSTGDLAQAESLFRQVLAMDRKLLGEEHPQTRIDLNNLANVLNDAGREEADRSIANRPR